MAGVSDGGAEKVLGQKREAGWAQLQLAMAVRAVTGPAGRGLGAVLLCAVLAWLNCDGSPAWMDLHWKQLLALLGRLKAAALNASQATWPQVRNAWSGQVAAPASLCMLVLHGQLRPAAACGNF